MIELLILCAILLWLAARLIRIAARWEAETTDG